MIILIFKNKSIHKLLKASASVFCVLDKHSKKLTKKKKKHIVSFAVINNIYCIQFPHEIWLTLFDKDLNLFSF